MKQIDTFDGLLGETIFAISGSEIGSEVMTFTLLDGSQAKLYHSQDCCETVSLEEIHGDLSDLIGFPLLLAEKTTSKPITCHYESATWTFYKMATINGYVTLRWLGQSNGYYSEEVDFGFSPSNIRINDQI